MSPQTCTNLSNVLKEVWNTEIADQYFDTKRQMNRQVFPGAVRFTGGQTIPYGHQVTMPINIDMSPHAVRERNRRNQEMMQRLARIERKGKPSYRERQRRGRAARG